MSKGVQSQVFVGRRDEMAALAALLERAGEGESGFAIIAGEAGVGKTRLTGELAGRAAERGFMVLTGQCVELGAEGLPLAPLIDALRALAHTTAPGELAEVLGPARRGLGQLLPELDPDAAGWSHSWSGRCAASVSCCWPPTGPTSSTGVIRCGR